MVYQLITQNDELKEAFLSPEAFLPSDELRVFSDWGEALANSKGVDLMFVDMVSTLTTPHQIEGYEKFALAKMDHADAAAVPLVLIELPAGYDIDFMVGWPDFVFARVRHPVTAKIFRRASTWI
jgi:hypothetical protein